MIFFIKDDLQIVQVPATMFSEEKCNLPVSLCKYLVKNLFRAGPPTSTEGKARAQFWSAALLKSAATADSSDPPELDLGLGNPGGDSPPSEVSLCRLTLGQDKSRGCIWQSSCSCSATEAMVYG